MPNTVKPQTEYPYQVCYKIDPSTDKKSASCTFENFAIYRFLIIPHENCLTRETAKSTPLPLLTRLPKFQRFTSEPPVGGIFKRDLRLCIISLEQNRMDKQGEVNHLYFICFYYFLVRKLLPNVSLRRTKLYVIILTMINKARSTSLTSDRTHLHVYTIKLRAWGKYCHFFVFTLSGSKVQFFPWPSIPLRKQCPH